MQECPDIGPLCDEGPVEPYRHVNTLLLVETLVEAEHGLSDGLSFVATVPFRWVRLGIRNETLDGAPYGDPPDEGIHHRNETLAGPGDPVLALRAGRGVGPVVAVGKLGLSFPFGYTEPNPFAAGEQGERHQHFQFGAGIFQPVVGADLLAPLGPVDLSLNAGGTIALYENRWGLRPSSRAHGTFEAGRAIGDAFRLGAGVTVSREWPERWSESQPEHEGNLGRTDVLLGARVRWQAREALALTLGGSVPVYTDAVGSEIDYPGTLIVGLSYAPAAR